MTTLFRYRWLSAAGITMAAALLMLLLGGELDLLLLGAIFILAAIACSYPSFLERSWQKSNLPSDTLHVAADRIRKGNQYDLYSLFQIPSIYEQIKSRYSLKAGDAGAPGLFLYFYLPSWLYDIRNIGPETVYRQLAERLKQDLQETAEVDLIAQRSLPLALGFRFLPKNAYQHHEMSRWISIVKTQYFRENTWVRGVLQSPKRQFRIHSPEDNEWRTFLPFLEDTRVLAGGATPAHDFRGNGTRRITLHESESIGAERVDYPERLPFGALLTYAKKGEIALEDHPDATDKLYIDRVNVLVHGSEHRREILQQLRQALKRELSEEDFYPLFNYGQKLRGYLPPGKAASDYVSSRGNFALYYDADRGWTLLKLETGLILQMQEAYWGRPPADINGLRPLTTSRATLVSGAPDSLLQFRVSTGTPTRGHIFTADAMIEQNVRDFAAAHSFQLLQPVGGGAEGCLFLAARNGSRFYLKNPDGQLAQEEMRVIDNLKSKNLIPQSISSHPQDRIIVSPEFSTFPGNNTSVATALVLRYVLQVSDAGYLCLDLTPDHVRIDAQDRRLFLIDFSGYVEATRFASQAQELVADRKKIEYRTPEELTQQFPDAEKFQVYLLGLLLYQMLHSAGDLPAALQVLQKGSEEYERILLQDMKNAHQHAEILKRMLSFDPRNRPTLQEVYSAWKLPAGEEETFWRALQS